MNWSGSRWRTWRESPTPIHQFPQGSKQRGVEEEVIGDNILKIPNVSN